jgi:predicted CoA-binding protein
MEFEKNKDQLDLFLSEADEALDIVAMIIDQMGHTQTIDDVRRNQQTNVWLQKLYEHPSYKAAVARKIKRHWDLI